MGFTKKLIGKNQIQEIENDINRIKNFLKADCLIFDSTEHTKKFKEYEEKYYNQRTGIK
jgi:hypothetical protein